jgi:hypothetical protein
MICPYCLSENALDALVCSTCSRDVAVPATLIAERDELLRKRDSIRDELRAAKTELEMIRTRNLRRPS